MGSAAQKQNHSILLFLFCSSEVILYSGVDYVLFIYLLYYYGRSVNATIRTMIYNNVKDNLVYYR